MRWRNPEVENDEFSYGCDQLEVLPEHPDGDEYMSLELGTDVRTEDRNCGVTGIQIVLLRENT